MKLKQETKSTILLKKTIPSSPTYIKQSSQCSLCSNIWWFRFHHTLSTITSMYGDCGLIDKIRWIWISTHNEPIHTKPENVFNEYNLTIPTRMNRYSHSSSTVFFFVIYLTMWVYDWFHWLCYTFIYEIHVGKSIWWERDSLPSALIIYYYPKNNIL